MTAELHPTEAIELVDPQDKPVDSPLRVIQVLAEPPDPRVLVMLGETSADCAAALRVVRHRLEQKVRRGCGRSR